MSSAEAVGAPYLPFPSFHEGDESLARPPLKLVVEAAAEVPAEPMPDTPRPTPEPLTPYQSRIAEEHTYLIDGAVRWVESRRRRRLDREEARGDAAEGLCRAAQNYNPTLQVAFETYAVHRMRGAVIDGERRFHRLGGPERTRASAVSQFNNTRARSFDAPLAPGVGLTLHDILPAPGRPVDELAIELASGVYDPAGRPLSPRQKAVAFLCSEGYMPYEIGGLIQIDPGAVLREYQLVVAAFRRPDTVAAEKTLTLF